MSILRTNGPLVFFSIFTTEKNYIAWASFCNDMTVLQAAQWQDIFLKILCDLTACPIDSHITVSLVYIFLRI